MEMENIYENIQDKNRNTVGPQTQSQNPTEAQSSRRWFVVITVCLGLICVLVIALIVQYIHLTAERDQMKMRNMNIVKECNKTLNSLKVNYSRLTEEKDQLQINFNSLSQKKLELETKNNRLNEEKDQLQINFNSLSQKKLELETKNNRLNEEKDQLQIQLTSISQMKLELETRVELMKSISGLGIYSISNEKKSWTDSRRFCRDRGADLIIINTEEEQKYISSLVNERVWIGLSDIETEGNMKWVDNTTLNKAFWDKGEPNDDKGNEDCVEMWNTKPFLNNWNDLPCSETRKWICEK